ncbi:MAG: hypothetical protein ACFFDW_06015 [Candidatus Thorarchaeota archaeon]
MKQCLVCHTTIEKGDFCDAHLIAKKNIEKQFKEWQTAFANLTWEAYLDMLITDESIPIGDWAKEVADYLLKNKIPVK